MIKTPVLQAMEKKKELARNLFSAVSVLRSNVGAPSFCPGFIDDSSHPADLNRPPIFFFSERIRTHGTCSLLHILCSQRTLMLTDHSLKRVSAFVYRQKKKVGSAVCKHSILCSPAKLARKLDLPHVISAGAPLLHNKQVNSWRFGSHGTRTIASNTGVLDYSNAKGRAKETKAVFR